MLTVEPSRIHRVFIRKHGSKDDFLDALKLIGEGQKCFVGAFQQICTSLLLKHAILDSAEGEVGECGAVHADTYFKVGSVS